MILAAIIAGLVIAWVKWPRRQRTSDWDPLELEAAHEAEALAPAAEAWQRLDAPEWLRIEGEKVRKLN